ncbi:hypothetical protein HDV03_002220 [Kappamyces sp. JEL0829]|nr:hypothetical protein HDV03_002220 [Kappamyces sp. JEL0829]
MTTSRKAIEVSRKDLPDDIHLSPNFYQEYYSNIDLSVHTPPTPVVPPRRSFHQETVASSMANRYQPSSKFHVKMTSAWKKIASKANLAFQKTFQAEAKGRSNFHAPEFQRHSVTSLPGTSSPVVYSAAANHRRVLSVQRPLPSPPAAATVPRDLHRRRPTAGPREMPEELKKVDGAALAFSLLEQLERIKAAEVEEKTIRTHLDGLVNLLDLYSTMPEEKIKAALEQKARQLDKHMSILQAKIEAVVLDRLPHVAAAAEPAVAVDEAPMVSPLDEELETRTQVNEVTPASRSSSNASLDRLKELTQKLVTHVKIKNPRKPVSA